MESRNYNHPSVRRLRHARFHLFIFCFSMVRWNLAMIIIPLCDVFVMLDFMEKLFCDIVVRSQHSTNHGRTEPVVFHFVQSYNGASLWGGYFVYGCFGMQAFFYDQF